VILIVREGPLSLMTEHKEKFRIDSFDAMEVTFLFRIQHISNNVEKKLHIFLLSFTQNIWLRDQIEVLITSRLAKEYFLMILIFSFIITGQEIYPYKIMIIELCIMDFIDKKQHPHL
ncbi:hypothetical protein ACJX0J_006252, partial [Zea mays]